jgi:hypothetical protein
MPPPRPLADQQAVRSTTTKRGPPVGSTREPASGGDKAGGATTGPRDGRMMPAARLLDSAGRDATPRPLVPLVDGAAAVAAASAVPIPPVTAVTASDEAPPLLPPPDLGLPPDVLVLLEGHPHSSDSGVSDNRATSASLRPPLHGGAAQLLPAPPPDAVTLAALHDAVAAAADMARAPLAPSRQDDGPALPSTAPPTSAVPALSSLSSSPLLLAALRRTERAVLLLSPPLPQPPSGDGSSGGALSHGEALAAYHGGRGWDLLTRLRAAALRADGDGEAAATDAVAALLARAQAAFSAAVRAAGGDEGDGEAAAGGADGCGSGAPAAADAASGAGGGGRPARRGGGTVTIACDAVASSAPVDGSSGGGGPAQLARAPPPPPGGGGILPAAPVAADAAPSVPSPPSPFPAPGLLHLWTYGGVGNPVTAGMGVTCVAWAVAAPVTLASGGADPQSQEPATAQPPVQRLADVLAVGYGPWDYPRPLQLPLQEGGATSDDAAAATSAGAPPAVAAARRLTGAAAAANPRGAIALWAPGNPHAPAAVLATPDCAGGVGALAWSAASPGTLAAGLRDGTLAVYHCRGVSTDAGVLGSRSGWRRVAACGDYL